MTAPPAYTERAESLGVPLLPDTSHETIQRYVMDRLEAESGGIVYAEGQWWQVNRIGAWVALPEQAIWAEVQRLNGLETLEGAHEDRPGKPIRVTAGVCESVAALARARFFAEGFFDEPAPGFIECQTTSDAREQARAACEASRLPAVTSAEAWSGWPWVAAGIGLAAGVAGTLAIVEAVR